MRGLPSVDQFCMGSEGFGVFGCAGQSVSASAHNAPHSPRGHRGMFRFLNFLLRKKIPCSSTEIASAGVFGNLTQVKIRNSAVLSDHRNAARAGSCCVRTPRAFRITDTAQL